MSKLAEILRRFLPSHKRRYALSAQQSKVIGSVMACRTSRLGASVQAVCSCGKEIVAYNSCRDRHCPRCQGRATRRWVAAQSERLLPAKYHHCVFTLPDVLCTLVRYNEALLYDLLFRASSDCLKSFFASDWRFGGQGGFLGILHTWGQRLQLHPHVHYMVACGCLRPDGSWKASDGYLFDVANLSKVFRGRFLSGVERLARSGRLRLPPGWGLDGVLSNLKAASRRHWMVYTRETFCGPGKVIEYIGRYAHKVAISESRILEVGEKEVAFEWKDYRDGGSKKTTSLPGASFARLFVQHVLPFGFKRVRYYGFWNPSGLKRALESIRSQGLAARDLVLSLLAVASEALERHESFGVRCPVCGALAFEAEIPAFSPLIDLLDTS